MAPEFQATPETIAAVEDRKARLRAIKDLYARKHGHDSHFIGDPQYTADLDAAMADAPDLPEPEPAPPSQNLAKAGNRPDDQPEPKPKRGQALTPRMEERRP